MKDESDCPNAEVSEDDGAEMNCFSIGNEIDENDRIVREKTTMRLTKTTVFDDLNILFCLFLSMLFIFTIPPQNHTTEYFLLHLSIINLC